MLGLCYEVSDSALKRCVISMDATQRTNTYSRTGEEMSCSITALPSAELLQHVFPFAVSRAGRDWIMWKSEYELSSTLSTPKRITADGCTERREISHLHPHMRRRYLKDIMCWTRRSTPNRSKWQTSIPESHRWFSGNDFSDRALKYWSHLFSQWRVIQVKTKWN